MMRRTCFPSRLATVSMALLFVLATCHFQPSDCIPLALYPTESEIVMSRESVNWLISQRRDDFGWGAQTPTVLLALMAAAPDRTVWDRYSTSGQLSLKQFENELLLLLLKNSSQQNQPLELDVSRLAHYVVTLAALCRPGKDFYGIDLIGMITNAEESRHHPFGTAFNALAACAGGGHVKKHLIRKILQLAGDSEAQLHNVDVLAMIVMATSCVTKSSHKYYHLANYLEEPLKRLVGLQRSDGSFGPNLDSTVLAYQALHQADHLHLAVNRSAPLAPSWKKQGALDWLRNSHHLDGSFGDLLTTSKVVLALSHRGFPSLHDNECRRPSKIVEPVQPSIPDATTPPNVNDKPITSSPDLIHFTYILWIGQNRSERHSIQMAIPVNTTFFEAMKIAAETDPNFEFSSTLWPNGHYIHTIAGHREQAIGFHFWLLFRTTFMPDPNVPPPLTNVAPAGVDDMFPENGDYYLFWFKDV